MKNNKKIEPFDMVVELDERLDPFDTGFEHGKGIKTNPVTEKLTVENLHSKLQECCYLTQDDKPIISQGSIKVVKQFLRQLQNEINAERFKLSDIELEDSPLVVYVSDINNIFDKYLNKEGGKE